MMILAFMEARRGALEALDREVKARDLAEAEAQRLRIRRMNLDAARLAVEHARVWASRIGRNPSAESEVKAALDRASAALEAAGGAL